VFIIQTEELEVRQEVSEKLLADEEAIEELLLNSNYLEEIEELSNAFNPFSVLKVGTVEIRHSNMISWLLSTSESHKLGDLFFKLLLKRLLIDNKKYFIDKDIDSFDLELLDYSKFYIEREHRTNDGALDILLRSDEGKILIMVENKVRSGLGHDQLTRYYNYAENNFEEYKRIYVLLAPEDSLLNREDEQRGIWIILRYTEIIKILEKIIEIRKSNIQPEVIMFLNHYIETVRREILGNSDLEKKCQKLYSKYPNAFKAINYYKPDREMYIKDFCREWINKHPELVEDDSVKTYIRFTPKSIADIEDLKIATNYTSSHRVVLFEIENRPGMISLKLAIGPIDLNNEPHTRLRKKIYDAVLPVGKKRKEHENWSWSGIVIKALYREGKGQSLEQDAICEQIEEKLEAFCINELPKYEKAIIDVCTSR
jgi:hypothetical protein